MQNFAYFQHVDSGSRQTQLVLQFVIEFANIWAQQSPSTYASTHVGFFDLCTNVQMAALSGCLSVTPLLLHGWMVGHVSGRCVPSAIADGVRQRSGRGCYSCHCERDALCHMACFFNTDSTLYSYVHSIIGIRIWIHSETDLRFSEKVHSINKSEN